MVKTKVQIVQHEDKTSKNGKDYTRFKIKYGDGSTKWASAFDKVVTDLKANENKPVEIELVQPEGSNYWNIREFYGVCEATNEMLDTAITESDEILESSVANVVRKSVKGTAYEKDPVGLTVDIFNVLRQFKPVEEAKCTPLMEKSISLVKQAQEAFR